MKDTKNLINNIIFILVINILFFIFLEGLFSTTLVLRDFISKVDPEIERFHAKYDDLLGWINIPNYEVKDLYGPGVYLKTNSQSFRNDKDFDVKVPKDKIRIICTGD